MCDLDSQKMRNLEGQKWDANEQDSVEFVTDIKQSGIQLSDTDLFRSSVAISASALSLKSPAPFDANHSTKKGLELLELIRTSENDVNKIIQCKNQMMSQNKSKTGSKASLLNQERSRKPQSLKKIGASNAASLAFDLDSGELGNQRKDETISDSSAQDVAESMDERVSLHHVIDPNNEEQVKMMQEH